MKDLGLCGLHRYIHKTYVNISKQRKHENTHLYVCMHACIHACMYVYIYVYICIYVYVLPPGSETHILYDLTTKNTGLAVFAVDAKRAPHRPTFCMAPLQAKYSFRFCFPVTITICIRIGICYIHTNIHTGACMCVLLGAKYMMCRSSGSKACPQASGTHI